MTSEDEIFVWGRALQKHFLITMKYFNIQETLILASTEPPIFSITQIQFYRKADGEPIKIHWPSAQSI